MRKLNLTYRQRQILKSVLRNHFNEWQSNPIDAILGALSKAGIGMSNDIVRAYERFRQEYEQQMHRWVNRILLAAGVMPRDLWGVGTPATDKQMNSIADELGVDSFPMITDSQADVILGALQSIKPKRIGKWLTTQEVKDAVKVCDTIGKETA